MPKLRELGVAAMMTEAMLFSLSCCTSVQVLDLYDVTTRTGMKPGEASYVHLSMLGTLKKLKTLNLHFNACPTMLGRRVALSPLWLEPLLSGLSVLNKLEIRSATFDGPTVGTLGHLRCLSDLALVDVGLDKVPEDAWGVFAEMDALRRLTITGEERPELLQDPCLGLRPEQSHGLCAGLIR